jgi:hypothetical protein
MRPYMQDHEDCGCGGDGPYYSCHLIRLSGCLPRDEENVQDEGGEVVVVMIVEVKRDLKTSCSTQLVAGRSLGERIRCKDHVLA